MRCKLDLLIQILRKNMHLGNVTVRQWKDSTKNADNNPVGFHITFRLGFLLNKTREERPAQGVQQVPHIVNR